MGNLNDGEIADHDVRIGPTNNDEMCNFYLMYWVEGRKPMAIEQVCILIKIIKLSQIPMPTNLTN